jgi:putative toxin-antitoxin system antitoxin component (TIGR02293 family)
MSFGPRQNFMLYPLASVLGGKAAIAAEPTTTTEWVARIRSGLPAASALAFKAALGLTNEELASVLGVSPRTVARLDPAKSHLDPVSGDRLVRSARLYAIAADVLEDGPAAARWLKFPQRALGGAVPLELAQTDVGSRAVEALLGRMEHGVFT